MLLRLIFGSVGSWRWRLWIAFDRFVNVLLGPLLNRVTRTQHFGNHDETLSQAFAKARAESTLAEFICRMLEFDPEHRVQ